MSFSLYWPIALIVLSNVFYHICAKSVPANLNPFASLTITYLVAAVASGILYYICNGKGNLLQEYQNINWTTFILGIAVVGLEFGSIGMYKVGWNINSGYLVHSILLAIVLVFIGLLLYHEAITWTKLAGVIICIVGIYFIKK